MNKFQFLPFTKYPLVLHDIFKCPAITFINKKKKMYTTVDVYIKIVQLKW